MKLFIVACALSAVAFAAPTTNFIENDDLIPETYLVDMDEVAADDIHSTIQELQKQGKGDAACKKLATDTKTAIEKDVKAAQKILNQLSGGKQCANESGGQTTVKKAETALKNAKQGLKDAQAAAKKALNAPINMGKPKLADVRGGACPITNEAKNKVANAEKKYQKAKGKVETAEGALKSAKKARDDAIAQQKKDEEACLCKVDEKNSAAWTGATKGQAAQDKAYKKSVGMLCVLSGTALQKCKLKAAPKLTKPKWKKPTGKCPICSKDWKKTTDKNCQCTKTEKVSYQEKYLASSYCKYARSINYIWGGCGSIGDAGKCSHEYACDWIQNWAHRTKYRDEKKCEKFKMVRF